MSTLSTHPSWIALAMLGWTGPMDASALDATGQSVLHCAMPDPALLRWCLGEGALVRIDESGRRETPLIQALRLGAIECARLLLDAGASVHPQDAYGYDALAHAIGMSQALVPTLLERGADPYVRRGTSQWSAFERAARQVSNGNPGPLADLQEWQARQDQAGLDNGLPAATSTRPSRHL
jgi:ankyrin repeat protein